QLKKITVATIDKKPSIARRNFMLLTPEVIWYPVAGVGFNKVNYLNRDPDFARFVMKVTPMKNLTAISTGKVRQDSVSFRFTPENDLNALSLIIGEFERKTIKVDKTELNLYIKPGHDFYADFFKNIRDTIPAIIKEAIEDYEKDIDLYYAFKRINLVEVPVQYHVYDRPATQVMGTLMPEVIMLPEKGVGISTLDFSRAEKIIKKQDRKSKNERTPEAMELDIFKRFVIATFFRSGAETRSMSQGGRRRSEKIVNFDKIKYSKNPYCVFPLYYNYTAEISSKDYPLFNSMIELYFKEGFAASVRQSFSGGMTASEKANLALKNSSMLDVFSQWDTELTSSLIKQTGGFILLALKNKVGASEFDNFLYYYVEDRAFSEISYQQFAADFYKEFEIDINPYFEILNSTGKIPVYRFSEPEYVQTRDEIGEVYLISFKISNVGNAKGLVDVTFRMGGRRGFGGGTTDEEQRIYELDAGVTKKVQVTLFEQPRMMAVNTLISANIPSTFNRFMRKPEKKRYVEVEEYEEVVGEPVMTGYRGEYIVDNEDEGFSYVSVSKESKIKKYIDSKKKKKTEVYYNNIFPYWSPNVWKAFAHSACYGDAIRSAVAVHSGDGSNTATWKQLLPEAGFYDLYVYIPKSAMYGRGEQDRGQKRGGSSGGGGGNQRGQQRGPSFMDKGTEYHYTVSSNEGSEEVIYKLSDNTEEGWNKIGVFHFPADTVYVHLSNKTNKRRVIADAIKMVKK
ncbi:MAG: hypothetical protein MI922_07140, partial [Bacteroidales bacterium]|nr:hypothetical protein [Bacteroidales bacterium]